MIVVALTLCVAGACSFGSTNDSAASPESGAAARDSLPTPIQDGIWNALTVEQARALASFPLAIPDPMPDSLQLTNIVVTTSPPSGALGTANHAELHIVDAGDTSTILLEQTTVPRESTDSPSATRTELDINGWTIEKVVDQRGGDKSVVSYTWDSEGVWYALTATMPSDVTEVQLEQLIANLKFEQ